ncbi:MAG TPA: class I SAM-dependent methyltransferase [Candidatus Nanoarchaeia archaeon]|nr:class I SAM-dependent methyltransferase [Candidatus Nanoarchaeia archaeon]
MTLRKQDIVIDSGKNFARQRSSDFYKLYYQYNRVFLGLLLDKVDKKSITLADYGGGNGIVAESILKNRRLKDKKCTIDIIDIDHSKLVVRKNIAFINKDALDYQRKNHYDYALSRFLVHYFDKKELEMFMVKVYNNLKPHSYFLLINWVQDTTDGYTKKRKILDIIEQEKNIACRTIPTTTLLTEIAKKVGFTIAAVKKVRYNISINDFYKHRFKLSAVTSARIIKKIGIARHQEQQIALLLKKS